MKTKFIISQIYDERFIANKSGTLNGIYAKLHVLLNLGQNFSKNFKSYHSFKKTIFSLTCILFMLSISLVNQAQQIKQVNDVVTQLLASNDPALKEQGVQLNQLIDDANPNLMANPTLLIDENGFKTIDGEVPIAVIVKKNAIEQLYSQHPDFENIQMIRIVAENETDLNLVVDLKKLNHFPNLKYVYFYTLFEVCPGNPGNKVCHASIFNNMVSGIEETSNIQVVYKVSFVQ